MVTAILALQAFHVLFLALHDWVPLGTLNDLTKVRAANPGSKLVVDTLVSTTPYAFGFAAGTFYFGRTYPGWLWQWLWITYAPLFLGELTA